MIGLEGKPSRQRTRVASSRRFGKPGRAAAELHQDYRRYLDDWQRQQHEAGERAFQDHLKAALEHQTSKSLPSGYAYFGGLSSLAQPLGANVYESANGSAQAAREQFEKKNPRQTFDELERRWKKGKVRR